MCRLGVPSQCVLSIYNTKTQIEERKWATFLYRFRKRVGELYPPRSVCCCQYSTRHIFLVVAKTRSPFTRLNIQYLSLDVRHSTNSINLFIQFRLVHLICRNVQSKYIYLLIKLPSDLSEFSTTSNNRLCLDIYSNMTSFKRFESKPVVKIILIYDRLNLWRHRQFIAIFYQFLHIRIEIIYGSHMYILLLPRVGLYVSFLSLADARGKTSWHKGLPVIKTIYT